MYLKNTHRGGWLVAGRGCGAANPACCCGDALSLLYQAAPADYIVEPGLKVLCSY